MNNLDQAKNMPVWCAAGIVGGLTLYVWLVFNISYIFRLLQEVRLFLLGELNTIIFAADSILHTLTFLNLFKLSNSSQDYSCLSGSIC